MYPGWHLTENIYDYYCLIPHCDKVKCFLVKTIWPYSWFINASLKCFLKLLPKVVNKMEKNSSIYLFLSLYRVLSLFLSVFLCVCVSLFLREEKEGDREGGGKGCVWVCVSTCEWMMSVLDIAVHMVVAMSYSEGKWAWGSDVTSHPSPAM